MKKFTADRIYTLTGAPLENHVVITDDEGVIVDIDTMDNHEKSSVKSFSGIITPGFVNTHCHLELSHMKGLVDTGTGLLPFLEKVVKFRNFPAEEIQQAIIEGDRAMYEDGIVAVGDISNTTDTVDVKKHSSIHYSTFVEMFDFMQSETTDDTIDRYVEVYNSHSDENGNKKSFVPHAPYTVSEGIYEYIRNENYQENTVSIHNQETPAENDLFLHKKGDFLPFYERFGFSLDKLDATGKTSIYHAMKYLNAMMKTLFVHNTLTTKQEILDAYDWNYRTYWSTCANANLYIENKLPDYKAFIDTDAKLTIGTDSLTSNWQLSVMEEMKTIKKYKSFVPVDTLITWATKNGAEALGYDDILGTIEKGKKPGLVHISCDINASGEIDIQKAKSKRIG